MTSEKPINLMSVCYNDRAIAWDKVWNPNVSIQDTAQSPKLSPFATMGDLPALQNIKVKVERDKRYTFGEIVTFYNKKHNLPKTIKTLSGKYVINKHGINANNNRTMARALKNLGLNLFQGEQHNGQPTKSISLNQWEAIRAEMYKVIQSHRYAQSWRDNMWKNECIGNGKGKKHTKVRIFDYFFTHIKEYETEKLYQNIKTQNALHNLFAKPDPSEKNYIACRIFKNSEVMHIFLNRVGEVFFFNRVYSEYKKDRQARGGQRLVNASKGNIKILQNSYTGRGFEIIDKKVIILTMRQCKAILVLMEYFRDLFLYGRGGDYLEIGIRALKRFLSNPQEAELKYQVAFTENKTYRSLWL